MIYFLQKFSFKIYYLRKSNVSYFKVFGWKCFVLNTKDKIRNFNPKSFEANFYWILKYK